MFHKSMVTKHEYSQGIRTERKTTKFSNILSELICGRGRRKYDRPFVNKEFHMIKVRRCKVCLQRTWVEPP